MAAAEAFKTWFDKTRDALITMLLAGAMFLAGVIWTTNTTVTALSVRVTHVEDEVKDLRLQAFTSRDAAPRFDEINRRLDRIEQKLDDKTSK